MRAEASWLALTLALSHFVGEGESNLQESVIDFVIGLPQS